MYNNENRHWPRIDKSVKSMYSELYDNIFVLYEYNDAFLIQTFSGKCE